MCNLSKHIFICNKRENNQQKKDGTITLENKYIKIILKGLKTDGVYEIFLHTGHLKEINTFK